MQYISLEKVDPFEDIQVNFVGAEPYGYAEIINNSDKSFLRYTEYKIEPSSGLSNKDKVKVTVKYNKDSAKREGYRLTDSTKTYKVSGLSEAVTKARQIGDDDLESLVQQAASVLKNRIDSRYSEIFKALDKSGTDSFFGGISGYTGDAENVKNYLLVIKKKELDNEELSMKNGCMMVFRMPTVIKSFQNKIYDGMPYFVVELPKLQIDEKRGIIANFETMTVCGVYHDSDAAEEYVESLKKFYDVTKMDSVAIDHVTENLAADVGDIPVADMKEMQRIAEREIYAHIQTWRHPETCTDTQYEGYFFAVSMSGMENSLFLVYEIEVTSSENEVFSFYKYIKFSNMKEDGGKVPLYQREIDDNRFYAGDFSYYGYPYLSDLYKRVFETFEAWYEIETTINFS